MKALGFTLLTDKGLISIHCNQFWEQYCHCKDVHPEEEPIKSALEHILGNRLNSSVPPSVMAGCGEIVEFYSSRAKVGSVLKAKNRFYCAHPDPKDRSRLQAEADNNWQLEMLRQATPHGPMQ